MQLLKRNQRTISYKNFNGQQVPLIDDDGYETGETSVGYTEIKTVRAYMTANRGDASEEMFGTTLDYDNILYAELSCDIDEFSLLWVDVPTTDANDYIVRRVATSLNHKAIAIKKVR